MTSQTASAEINPESIIDGMNHLIENDPEWLARLNDFAEIMIWGSNGRNVYTLGHANEEYFLLGSKNLPVAGILNAIVFKAGSGHYESDAERDAAIEKAKAESEEYERAILGLVDKGIELAAAKDIVDLDYTDLPLPMRHRRIFLQEEIRLKQRKTYLANGGELPFEDSDVPSEVSFVNYRKTAKPEKLEFSEYSLLPEWITHHRANVLEALGPEWPRADIATAFEGVRYRIEDINDGTEPKAELSWLQTGREMPYTPFYPGDRSQWHVF